MGKNYYIPVSSYVFPELASAEALSPTTGDIAGVFVGRGSYPTKVTGDIPVNPVNEALTVYSEPVTWKYRDSSVMDYPLVIKLPETAFDVTALMRIELPSLPQGIVAWAYSKTVFFPNDGSVRYLFRNDEEMLQQIQRLSPFQEVKDIALVKDSCESFEDLRMPPAELPDEIKAEVREEVSKLALSTLDKGNDIQIECRTGACLGYSVGRFRSSANDTMSADLLIKDINDKDASDKAARILHNIRVMQRNLAEIVMDAGSLDYDSCEIMLKPRFRHKGRSFIDDWGSLDRILRRCVDFISTYPPTRWNWFGNEERFAFIRDLWNNVLKDELERENMEPSTVDVMRKEIENVCRHFKSPNTIGIGIKDVHSRIVQALYIVLQCNGDTKVLDRMLKDAKRPDYCLALYGAFKGYSYFSRILVPERLRRTPTRVSREDILSIVASVKGKGGGKNWKQIIKAIDRAMSLELERQSAKAFLYILNNLMPRNDSVYRRIEAALRNDVTEYDYVGFRAKVRKVVDEIGDVSEEQRNAIMLAIELEDKRRNPVAFKYILDDCIREEGRGEEYKRAARQLVERLDLGYGGMPSDIEDDSNVSSVDVNAASEAGEAHENDKQGERDLFGNEIPPRAKKGSAKKKSKGKTK